MIPVVERQMRTLTVGIGTLFDGNCGEKSFPEFFVRVRSGFREGKAFYFIRRKTGQVTKKPFLFNSAMVSASSSFRNTATINFIQIPPRILRSNGF